MFRISRSRMKVYLFLALFLLAFHESAAVAAGFKVLKGHVPAAVSTAPDLGAMKGDERLQLTLGLPVRDEKGLEAFLTALYDPKSPAYGHYLSPGQFGSLYGASSADYQTVLHFAKAHHLKVESTYASHLLVTVSGTVADIQKAFQVELHYFQRALPSSITTPPSPRSLQRERK